jgi:hypothetical protein
MNDVLEIYDTYKTYDEQLNVINQKLGLLYNSLYIENPGREEEKGRKDCLYDHLFAFSFGVVKCYFLISQKKDKPLYLLIHNIDGNCLRETSIQFCLSELASNKHVHILASVDHINSSLRNKIKYPKSFFFDQRIRNLFYFQVWDQIQYASFKWLHFEVNTLEAYNAEIVFENSLMLSQMGML